MNMPDNLRGALTVMAAMAAFTLNDALMKSISDMVPLFQQAFLRGVLTTTIVAVWAARAGAFAQKLSRSDRRLVLARSLSEVGAAYFFLTALFNMPLANVTAILQSLPLTVSLCAAIFLKESLGWRRITAILVGLVGVMMIIRPGTDAFSVHSLYALIAVAMVTIRDLTTRKLSKDTPSLLVTVSASFGVTLFFGLGSIGTDWVPLTAFSASIIVAAAGVILVGYLLSVMMMRVGDVGFIAPFRYTGLIWALALGWVMFGDWPDPITLVGAGIVACSGIFMLYRESQFANAAKRPADE